MKYSRNLYTHPKKYIYAAGQIYFLQLILYVHIFISIHDNCIKCAYSFNAMQALCNINI